METDCPPYGCLHPMWQRQHKDKSLSVEEWPLLWQAEMSGINPIWEPMLICKKMFTIQAGKHMVSKHQALRYACQGQKNGRIIRAMLAKQKTHLRMVQAIIQK